MDEVFVPGWVVKDKIQLFNISHRMDIKDIDVFVASEEHLKYAPTICQAIETAAYARGTGIAKRKPEYIENKMKDGKAIIALTRDGQFAGFSYIETWEHEKYVATSGLIVVPEYRMSGLAKKIKHATFLLARTRFPESKIFSITTSLAVMKLNTNLGYKPVTFSELTTDETFWSGCQGCVNFDVLSRNNRRMCLCTGMLFDPKTTSDEQILKNISIFNGVVDFHPQSQTEKQQ